MLYTYYLKTLIQFQLELLYIFNIQHVLILHLYLYIFITVIQT